MLLYLYCPMSCDGHKEVIVPSFVHYLEVIEAADGAKAVEDGWPGFHESTVHASPLLYDIDADGILDVLLATYDGEVLMFKDTGERQENHTISDLIWRRRRRQLLQADFKEAWQAPPDSLPLRSSPPGPPSQQDLARMQMEMAARAFGDPDEGWSKQEVDPDSFNDALTWGDLPLDSDRHSGTSGHVYDDYAHNFGGWDHRWKDVEAGWGSDLDDFSAPHISEGGFLWLDAHILATPALADIDGDGVEDLVLAVTYFFDHDVYSDPDKLATLGTDVDITKYVGGGLVAYDLHTRLMKWQTHLDLSTDQTSFRAHIYSPPTIVDLEGDGSMEILIGTSMGFLYVMDALGKPKEGWPVQMGEIQAQVAVADVNNDGFLEVAVGDTKGTLAVFTHKGEELWERHVASAITQAASFGDINADGALELVFATASGAVYAVSAATGKDIAGFPFRTRGRIMSPVLLTRAIADFRGLQIVVPAADGHLYIIDGILGCADVVDIGETAYAQPLVDDLDGDGRLELLLATMGGNLYSLGTGAPVDPLAVLNSAVHGQSSFVARSGWVGLAATADARAPRDIRGRTLPVRFDITDRRPAPLSNVSAGYKVAVKLEGVGASDMRGRGDSDDTPPVIGVVDTFLVPGTFSAAVLVMQPRVLAGPVLPSFRRSGGLSL
ncbi:hypothetical protein WJX73_009335 [Symbiochloris irregularis]|uniref:DEX1 C-terminal domain-containing protein n=1 Tax=Symbiochloris irregularis TaxID=706552 RepID=A0AAW1Q311_9CHLO